MSADQDRFGNLVGIRLVEAKEGYAKTILKVTKTHTNFMGVIHGGLIFTLADCAFANAVNYGEKVAVAVQADISFLKPSYEGDVLTAEAVRISESKKLGFYRVTVSREEEVIAVFSGLAYNRT